MSTEQGFTGPAPRRERYYDAEGHLVHECDETCDHLADDMDEPLITKSGKVLTNADIEALADEAERGYDIDPSRVIAVGARRVWRNLTNRRGVMTVLRIDVLNRRVLVKWEDRTTDWLEHNQYLDETEPAP